MALSKDEINFYNDQGYLLVEDVISENQHKEMLALVDGFFEKSKMIKENDNIFDLEDGHSSDNPRLKRIKQPHQHSQFFWDIIKESKIEEILNFLNSLNGTLFSRMTGSGATCFALFDNLVDLESAETYAKKRFDNYWIKSSKLINSIKHI